MIVKDFILYFVKRVVSVIDLPKNNCLTINLHLNLKYLNVKNFQEASYNDQNMAMLL